MAVDILMPSMGCGSELNIRYHPRKTLHHRRDLVGTQRFGMACRSNPSSSSAPILLSVARGTPYLLVPIQPKLFYF